MSNDFFTMEYPSLNETLNYKKLANGLSVYIVKKEGFTSSVACVGPHFGSVHKKYLSSEQMENVELPDGLAHFLEHKMFESDDGNVLQKFSELGASPNAFTSFEKTVYYFTCTENFGPCLDLLMDLMRHPYFTDENVRKEQGIIGQEIDMGNDDPDRRVLFNLMKGLYKEHPIRNEIAGTKESIAGIDKEMLTTCHRLFYNPEKLQLVVVGDVEPEDVFNRLDAVFGEEIVKAPAVRVILPNEPDEVCQAEVVERMSVVKPKVMLGFKDHPGEYTGVAAAKRETAIEIMMDCVFGKSSDWYMDAYNKQIINDTFGYYYDVSDKCAYAAFGCDSDDTDAMVKHILAKIRDVRKNGVDEADFNRIAKMRKGEFVMGLDSPKAVAFDLLDCLEKEMLLFDYVDIYDKIDIDYALEVFREAFDERYMSVSKIETLER